MIPGPTQSPALVDNAIEIYERDLKRILEPTHIGKYLIIDVDSAEYELGTDLLSAARAMRGRRPTGNLVALRVGRRAAGHLGFTPRP